MLTSFRPRLRLDQFALGGLGVCATPGSTPCCSSPCKVCVGVCPSNVHVAGLTVVVKSGATTVFTGTTDATGCVALTGVGSGTYTIQVFNGGTMIFSGSRACPGTITIAITSPSNSFCCSSCPIPNTLFLTDNAGTTTLTGTSGTWTGSHFLSIAGMTTTGNCPPAFPVTCMCVAATISLNLRYTVVCVSASQLMVTREWNTIQCANGGPCSYGDWNALCTCGAYDPITGCGSITPPTEFPAASSITSAWSQCSPFMWSGTPVFVSTDDPACNACAAGGALPDPGGPIVITA